MTITDLRRSSPGRRRTAAVLASLAAALLLAGCETPLVAGATPEDGYRTSNPILVQEGVETLDIPVALGTSHLTASSRDNVVAFARSARADATGPLVIMVPSGSANTATASYLAGEIRQAAAEGGLSGAQVQTVGYRVDDPAIAAPIRLSYSRIKAMTARDCGLWPQNILLGSDNRTEPEFGCSTQANLAAMVENPEDLLHPRAATPAAAATYGAGGSGGTGSGASATGTSLTGAL